MSRAANLKSDRYPPSRPLSRRWEFCAPHYYDFEVGDAADAQPDAWFDSAQTAGLKTPVALLDKAQTNAAAKQAAAEVTAEQAKENPPSAVKSAAKAARTPGATSATRALTPRSDNGAMPGSSSRKAKTPATGRSAMAASRAGGAPFPTEPPVVDDGATDEDSAEYATAGETPGTASKSVAKSKTPAAATPANGAAHPESHPESSATAAKESTASKGSSQRARRSARTSTVKKATPEPTAMDVDSPVAAVTEPEPEAMAQAAPVSTAIALISPVSSPRTSPRLAAAASARERIEEAAVAMDDDASRAAAAAPTRRSPRLTAARAAAHSTGFVAAKTPGRGPVAGTAASKTPSRFAPIPAPEPVDPEPVSKDPEPASKKPEPVSKEPEPVSKPRRRKGLTGGGAVRVLVSEQRVQVQAVEAEAVTLHREEATGERRAMSPARPRRVGASVDPVAEKPAARAVPRVPPAVATRTTRAMAARAAAIAGAKREREAPAPPRTHASRSSAGARGKFGANNAKLTVPISPNLSRPPKRARAAQKTTEELALEKSRAAAAEEKERMRVAARRAAARGAPPRRAAAKPPSTKPTTPSFARTHRMATRAVVQEASHGHARDENSPSRSSVARTFSRTRESESFHNRAPTKPRSPALSKSNAVRTRSKTTEELELEAIAAAPKFRARPVRRAVLEGAGDAAERAKAAAEQRRVATRRAKEGVARKGGWDKQLGRKRGAEAAADEEERAAREAKRRREMETYGHGGFMPPTAPESPRLKTSRRALLKAPAPAADAGARGVVGGGASRVAQEPESADWSARPLTQPLGFNLTTDKRGAYARKVLERREAEEEEAAALKRRVVAKPVPATTRRRSSQCFVPNEIKVTQFQPFNLKGEALHEYERKREAQRREEEEAAARARAEFKARPLPFSTFNPMFEFNPSDAAPTVPMDLKLPGDSRAESRARFDDANARRIAEQERARAEEERERVANDERERRRMRRSMVFKARDVPDYAELATVGVAPVPEAELTVPESPFATRRSRRVYRYN